MGEPAAASQHTVLFLSKTGSMKFFEMQGPNSTQFRLPEGTLRNMLCARDSAVQADPAAAALSTSNNALRRVHVYRITLEPGSTNEFPFALGVRIEGVPGTEFNVDGHDYNAILPAGFAVHSPLTVFETHGDEELFAEWEKDFGRWTLANLETFLVMPMPDTDVMMVHADHPVVQFLQKRPDVFGNIEFMAPNPTAPAWVSCSRKVFQDGASWIRNNILLKSSQTFDLSKLTVSFQRLDARSFAAVTPTCYGQMPRPTPGAAVKDIQEYKKVWEEWVVQHPFSLSLRIGIHFRPAQA